MNTMYEWMYVKIKNTELFFDGLIEQRVSVSFNWQNFNLATISDTYWSNFFTEMWELSCFSFKCVKYLNVFVIISLVKVSLGF